MLREEEVLGAELFDGCVKGKIIKEHGSKDAAFCFLGVRKRWRYIE
jgi:hypothetical protein